MTTGLRNAKTTVAAVAVLAMVAVPHAQQPAGSQPAPINLTLSAPAPTSPQAGPSVPLQAPPIDKYIPGEAKPPATPGSPLVDLTLERSIQIALEKNLDLQVARINPLLQDFSLKASRAAFLPTLTSSFTENHSLAPSTNSAVDGGLANITTNNQSYKVGVNQNMKWYGGSLTASFTSGRNGTNNPNQKLNPQLSAGLSASYTQPLLSGFRMDNTRNTIRTGVIQRQITDITLQNSIETTKASVRNAYWALRQAIESIEIQRRSLDLANRQLTESQQRVEIGTLAPIDATSFDVNVATAEQALLNAQITWNTAELTFKRLLVTGADDDLYKATINPVDKANFSVSNVDINAAVQNALAQRTDLESARKNLTVSEMNLDVTRSSSLPSLSVTGGYSLSGTGGPSLSNNVVVPGGYWDAISTLSQRPSWNVGFNFSYPLGLVSQQANLARAELGIDQAKAQQKALELTVTADVTQAGLNVNNTYLQLKSATKSRVASELNAEAAQTRFSAGLATAFEVATALQSLTTSRLNELNAIIRYINAIADFDKKQRVGG